MNQNDSRLQYLINQYANGISTVEEEAELFSLLGSTAYGEVEPIFMAILEQTTPMPDAKRRQRLLEKIWDPAIEKYSEKGAPVRRLQIFTWRKIAVAASVLLMIGLGSYFLFFNNTANKTDIAKNTTVPQDVKAPATNRAMITMANGQKVYLDSVMNGQLAQQNGVDVIKLADGRIAYNGVATELVYNTLTNPRGSMAIDITLADGSRVWLNAGSSITYPIAFVDKERKVTITGEAYFEVAHDAAKPFIVNKNDINVAVLGTHFNVKAYDNENDTKVTLLEGSVKVYTSNGERIIKPGQQAIATNGQLSTNNDVDLDEVMAWKNGKFIFNGTDVQNIMQQLSNWYDMEVIYQGKISKETFSGVVNRNVNISQVLKLLEEGGVKCKVEGKRLTVEE